MGFVAYITHFMPGDLESLTWKVKEYDEKKMKGFSNAVFLFFQKEDSLYQLKLKEKDNSLRIISAVIESMKYWCEHAQKTVLLFEILGRYGTSKNLSNTIWTIILNVNRNT